MLKQEEDSLKSGKIDKNCAHSFYRIFTGILQPYGIISIETAERSRNNFAGLSDDVVPRAESGQIKKEVHPL